MKLVHASSNFARDNPGMMLAPENFTQLMPRALYTQEFDWHPARGIQRSPGQLISPGDKMIHPSRNGSPIR